MKISSLTKENYEDLKSLNLIDSDIEFVVSCFHRNSQVRLWIDTTKKYHEKYDEYFELNSDFVHSVFKGFDFPIHTKIGVYDILSILERLKKKRIINGRTDAIKMTRRILLKSHQRNNQAPIDVTRLYKEKYRSLKCDADKVREFKVRFNIHDLKDLIKYIAKDDIPTLIDKGIISIKNPENVPSQFVPVTFKYLVDNYFGIDFKTVNAPKLSTQLKKLKVDATQKEIAFFGSVKKYFEGMISEYGVDTLYIDNQDFRVPDIVDNWAFRGSCNTSESSAGRDTHLYHRNIGGSYLRGYTYKDVELVPFLRMYFYKLSNDLMHAGIYSMLSLVEIEFSTVLLCVLFGRRIADFKPTEGLPFVNNNSFFTKDEYKAKIWHNMNEENKYSVVSTNGVAIRNYLIDNFSYEEVINSNYSIHHYLEKKDSLTYERVKL